MRPKYSGALVSELAAYGIPGFDQSFSFKHEKEWCRSPLSCMRCNRATCAGRRSCRKIFKRAVELCVTLIIKCCRISRALASYGPCIQEKDHSGVQLGC